MTIGEFLKQQTKSLGVVGITTSRLDVLVLLGDALKKDKSWILAHPETRLTFFQHSKLRKQCAKRAKRIPLAYIRKKQQFYGRDFYVDRNVLVPRPESEAIIEVIKRYSPATLFDVGTGSGCLAITAALELPDCEVVASDISNKAIRVAYKNDLEYGTDIAIYKYDLLGSKPVRRFDMITANLPYVDESWERSPETDAEPALALFAGDNGLALIKKLLVQAPRFLTERGILVLEADPRQHKAIIVAAMPDFTHVATDGFILTLQLRKASA